MKKNSIYAILFCIAVTGVGCSPASQEKQAADNDEWQAMDSFHLLMAEAFHPYKDSANLEPAKKLATELVMNAAQWQAAALPEKVNNDEMKALLSGLKTDSQQFADHVTAGAAPEQLGASLTALHDRFHQITEAWHGGGEHEH